MTLVSTRHGPRQFPLHPYNDRKIRHADTPVSSYGQSSTLNGFEKPLVGCLRHPETMEHSHPPLYMLYPDWPGLPKLLICDSHSQPESPNLLRLSGEKPKRFSVKILVCEEEHRGYVGPDTFRRKVWGRNGNCDTRWRVQTSGFLIVGAPGAYTSAHASALR